MSRETLCDIYHISDRTLRRHINKFLSSPPKPIKPSQNQEIFLKVDATYFKNWGCLMVYKAGDNILYWNYGTREYDLVYEEGLQWLKQAGYIILGVTSDWHGSIVRSVQRIHPAIPHQRCLIHTQRFCESLLTKNPQTEAGVSLRYIVLELNHITNSYEKNIWLRWFDRWTQKYEDFTTERTYQKTEEGQTTWWYTHKNVRSVYRSLQGTLDHLFLYLDHRRLDKDTNGLEAEFTYLKERLTIHRGLSKKKRFAFLSWYLFFKIMK